MTFRLTSEQQAIIEASAQARILVEAAAGTGKTEVVARRIAHLIAQGFKPRDILVLSFSRAAVRVLTERLRQLAKESAVVEDLRWAAVRTFDSWAFRLLRQLGWDPATLLSSDFNENMERVLTELKAGEAALANPEARLRSIRHLIVDEMQDVTSLRARLVQRLLELLTPPADTARGFTLLGDSCQAIYGWTAGDDAPDEFTSRDLLKWLKRCYAAGLKELPLTGNRRATPELARLLDKARQSVDPAVKPDVALKGLLSVREGLESKTLKNTIAEMRSPAKGSMAILCRDNGQVLTVAEEVEKYVADAHEKRPAMAVLAGSPPRSLPSWIGRLLSRFEGTQLSRRHFGTLFSTLEAERAPCAGDPDEAWRMLLRFARLGEGETAVSMDLLRQRVAWPDSLPDDEGETARPVVLTTIHQSKGREFDRVSLLSAEAAPTANADEEARVIYVSLTRARSQVASLQLDHDRELYSQACWNERKRWHRWDKTRKGAYHRLELGMEGDLEKDSCVREGVLGDVEAVERLQRLLTDHEETLVGLPVRAGKTVVSTSPLRVAYRIFATTSPGETEVCLGQLSDDVRRDIAIVKHKQQNLPTNIYGLRIGSVCTYVCNGELPADVLQPWRDSRIWLGVTIHGLAQFVTYWKAGD